MVSSNISDYISSSSPLPNISNIIHRIPRTLIIYILKIYKPDNPDRPIVSAWNCSREMNSKYLDGVLAPLVISHTSHISYTSHLHLFNSFSSSSSPSQLIFALDVKSLYTVISHDDELLTL